MNLCDREEWMDDVEIYAPGYLVLEAEGRPGKYPYTVSLYQALSKDSENIF